MKASKKKIVIDPPYVAPVSLEPLYTMLASLEAIVRLAETRQADCIEAALQLNRHSISHNDCLFILSALANECRAKQP